MVTKELEDSLFEMNEMNVLSDVKLCIVGLGYVGLPLAVEFGKNYPTIGFDLNSKSGKRA